MDVMDLGIILVDLILVVYVRVFVMVILAHAT